MMVAAVGTGSGMVGLKENVEMKDFEEDLELGVVLSISEVRSYHYHSSSSLYRTLSWLNIKEIWRSKIVENVVIVSVLLVIKSDFNNCLSQYIRRRRNTNNLGRVYYLSRYLCQILKHAECIISVINRFILEWEEVSTLD